MNVGQIHLNNISQIKQSHTYKFRNFEKLKTFKEIHSSSLKLTPKMSTDLLWQAFSYHARYFPSGGIFPIGLNPTKRVMYCNGGRKVWISVATILTAFSNFVLVPAYLLTFRAFPPPGDNYSVTLLHVAFGIIVHSFTIVIYIFIWLYHSDTVKGFNNIVGMEAVVKSGKLLMNTFQ